MSAALSFAALLCAAAISALPNESQEAPKAVKEVEEKIQRELKQPTAQGWIKTPLRLVIGVVSDQHKIPIKIDAKALKKKNLSPDLEITANIKGVTLGDGLTLMIGDFGLTYVVKNGALLITTKEAAEKQPGDKTPAKEEK
jgi:hypothetical protein